MHKKEYCIPKLDLLSFSLRDVIMSSVEDFTSHAGSVGDWGDIEPDPDDEIID